MKRWLAVFVASAALLASTATPPDDDEVIEDPENPTIPKRTDAGLEFEIYSVTAVPGILEGTIAAIDQQTPSAYSEKRSPDAGDPWLEALTPRTLTASNSGNGATATTSLEFQRPDAGHFRFIMSGSATAPDTMAARTLAGFTRMEIVVKDRGLTGVKATAQCSATYGGNYPGTGALKVVAGEIISGDDVCVYNWLSPVVSSGTVNATSSDETDGTDRKSAVIYVNVALTATSNRWPNEYDGGSGNANGTVDLFIEPQY